MAGRSHLSIGEVLSLLQDEFPDVTISKIRFLESQGLVDPERTPSGYRKFYETDIDRLRWVLRQQRDAFLPLKVIKGRLDEDSDPAFDDVDLEVDPGELRGAEAARSGAPEGFSDPGGDGAGPSVDVGPGAVGSGAVGSGAVGSGAGGPSAVGSEAEVPSAGQLFDAGPAYGAPGAAARADLSRRQSPVDGPSLPMGPDQKAAVGGRDAQTGGPVRSAPVSPAANPARAEPATADPATANPASADPASTDPVPTSAARTGAARTGAVRTNAARTDAARTNAGTTNPGTGNAGTGRKGRRGSGAERRAEPGVVPDDEAMALEELVSETGVEVGTVRDLERYGLITPMLIGGASYYTREAAIIAQLASGFARHGVEARHLRAYKGAADREAGLVQQVIMPLIRQRNPEARQAAVQVVEELSQLGGELRAALLRSALTDLR